MNTTFDASYRTRAVRNLLKAYDVKSIQNRDPAFERKMAEIIAKRKEASEGSEAAENLHTSERTPAAETDGAVRIQTENLSMEEYKEYIYDKISQLPMHPGNRQDYVAVQISDAGLEAMKNDPEYEQWVLDSIRSNFVSRDPWSGMCGGKYVILYFGDTKEQSRGESWRAGLNGSGNKLFNQKSKDSFWEQRAQRRKELQEQYEELLELKELNKDPDQGLYYGDLAILAAFRPKPLQSGMPQE